MIRLDVWLKLYGKKIEENLWSLPKNSRVRDLLLLWGGPCIEEKTKFILDKDFDGELRGSWDTIKDEIDRTPGGVELLDKKELTDDERYNRYIYL